MFWDYNSQNLFASMMHALCVRWTHLEGIRLGKVRVGALLGKWQGRVGRKTASLLLLLLALQFIRTSGTISSPLQLWMELSKSVADALWRQQSAFHSSPLPPVFSFLSGEIPKLASMKMNFCHWVEKWKASAKVYSIKRNYSSPLLPCSSLTEVAMVTELVLF